MRYIPEKKLGILNRERVGACIPALSGARIMCQLWLAALVEAFSAI